VQPRADARGYYYLLLLLLQGVAVMISSKSIEGQQQKAMSQFIELSQITGSPGLAAVYNNRLLPR
jgi:hypothetical protein